MMCAYWPVQHMRRNKSIDAVLLVNDHVRRCFGLVRSW